MGLPWCNGQVSHLKAAWRGPHAALRRRRTGKLPESTEGGAHCWAAPPHCPREQEGARGAESVGKKRKVGDLTFFSDKAPPSLL